MIITVDAVVIGAGVVGLACARTLSKVGLSTVILEKNSSFGQEQSSRNSEVIHAGIYYPKGSLKAELCVRGKYSIYQFCKENFVPFKNCGKLIIANSVLQEEKLHDIKQNALINGVDDLMLMTAKEVQKLEPEIKCTQALYSPSTGIVDSHKLMLAILAEFDSNEGMQAYNAFVKNISIEDEYFRIEVEQNELFVISSRILINAAGLFSQNVAKLIRGFPVDKIPIPYFAKGNYFSYSGVLPFSRLIYPVPEPGGLGVHLTLDLSGRGRFGPDVEWVEDLDYSVNVQSSERFYSEIRKYWPGLPDGMLMPDYAGIRSKISGPGMPNADFIIQGKESHGVSNLINLFGIESPGLTSSLAISDKILEFINF